MQSNKLKGQVTLFGVGGCGINIGTQLEEYRNRNEKSFANLHTAYIDTSRSNLTADIDPEHCYLIDGLDGSGKVRAENHAVINQHVPVILQRFPVGDVAIVLHSLSGGSGSVGGPLLVSELLSRGIPTIVIAVGSTDTKIEAMNTLKTLKSYAAIVEMRETPLAMCYVQNDPTQSRDAPDAKAISMILALSALFSRENTELDSKDLLHWLLFNKTTSFGPQLAALSLLEAGQTMANLGNVISVATLAKRGDRTALPGGAEYQTVGFLEDDADSDLRKRAPLHFIISDGVLATAAKQLQAVIDKFEATGNIRQQQNNLLGKSDRPVESGLVL